MKYSRLTVDQYITLLKQSSSTIHSNELYICTRKAHVTIQNHEDVITILTSVKKYMKFNIFDGIFDVLNQKDKESRESTEVIKKLQAKLISLQNQLQNAAKGTTVTQTNENRNISRELKKTCYFRSVYKFLDGLSAKGNREMISKACEEGLWEKTNSNDRNILQVASQEGNLKLVKSLIECGCYKEAKDNSGWTPLLLASYHGHLEVVKYLNSVEANKEAKDEYGRTSLMWASYKGHLEVVQYLISVGSNKEAKDNDGKTALSFAKDNVRDYLKSIGSK